MAEKRPQAIQNPKNYKDKIIIGELEIDDFGGAKFYYPGDFYPTFESPKIVGSNSKKKNFEWYPNDDKSIPNLAKRLYPDRPEADAIAALNARLKDVFNEFNKLRYTYYATNKKDLIDKLGIPKPKNIASTTTGATGAASGQTSPPNPSTPTDPTNPTEEAPTTTGGASLEEVGPIDVEGVGIREGYDNYIYPNTKNLSEFDSILFKQVVYGTRPAGVLSLNPRKYNYNSIKGSVRLPIQNISDTNQVSWNEESINPLQMAGVSFALNVMNSDISNIGNVVGATADQLMEELNKNKSELVPAFRQWAAGQAVGLNNLLSRTSGAIVNNNIELLFSSPKLRTFTFNYTLYPRNRDEAEIVRGIIRFFKEGMVVRRTPSNLFLKAPNVFNIEYKTKRKVDKKIKEDIHPSLNRIKNPCALTDFQTNYTPNNSYMTFNDDFSTMTAYSIAMTFVELEPLYSTDYFDGGKSLIDTNEIGY
jgi:hypothetical protein